MRRLIVIALLAPALPLRADDKPVTNPAAVAQHYHQVAAQTQYQDLPDEEGINTEMSDWLSQWFRHLGSEIGTFKYAGKMPAIETMIMTLLVIFSISVLAYVLVRLTRRRAMMELERSTDSPNERSLPPPEFYDEEI